MTDPSQLAVEIVDVTKTFAGTASKRAARGQGDGTVAALNDVSLTVSPGEFVSLIGPSGCGKSTLLRLIGDLDENKEGTAMLQDAIWANTAKLSSDKAYQATTVKFLKAVVKGWIYARDNPQKAADIVVSYGTKLGTSHQLWQTNEVNKLIWPSPNGIGVINAADWKRTVGVAMDAKNLEGSTVITKAPDSDAYTNTYIKKALAELKSENLDTTGANFKPIDVTLAEGGE